MNHAPTSPGRWTGPLCGALLLATLPAAAQTVPGFTVSTYAEPVTGPVFLSFAPDGRVFVGDGNGRISEYAANGTLLNVAYAQFASRSALDFGFINFPCDITFGPDRKLYMSHSTGARISRIEANDVGCVFGDRFEP